jgi:hypothetical protein
MAATCPDAPACADRVAILWASARGAVQMVGPAVLPTHPFLPDRQDAADMVDHLARLAASGESADRVSGHCCFVGSVDRCRVRDLDCQSAWADAPLSPCALLRHRERRRQDADRKADCQSADQAVAERPASGEPGQSSAGHRARTVELELVPRPAARLV